MVSTNQYKFVKMSLRLAEESTYRYRLGAVIVAGGRVRGSGISKYQNSPVNVADQHLPQCSVHAEMDALRHTVGYFRTNPLKRATIYVARVTKLNQAALAKPCHRCTTTLLACGVTKMVWTIDTGTCGTAKLTIVPPENLCYNK